MSKLNIRRRLTIKKPMTYILGARCKDGVVLVADRKVTYEDGHIEWQDKLFRDFTPIVFGGAGAIGFIQHFRDRLMRYYSGKSFGLIDDYVFQMEKNVGDINTLYNYTQREFEVLAGIRTTVGAVLQYIAPAGIAETITKYKVIGSGEPHGSIILKILWREDMSMLETAKLGYFIIMNIDKLHLTDWVGVGDDKPNIWFIPDNSDPYQADSTLLNEIATEIQSKLEALKENIHNAFT